MPQFSEKRKLILRFLIINCELHHMTEEEAMKYICQNFRKEISRRTFYNYKHSIYNDYKESPPDKKNWYPGLPMVYSFAKCNKGLISMSLLIERKIIIQKGLEKGITLKKYDKMNFVPRYYKDQIGQTDNAGAALIVKSKQIIEKIQSQK